jgi:hypothetical protein
MSFKRYVFSRFEKIARTYELSVTHALKMDKGEDSTKDTKEEEVNKVQKKKRTQFISSSKYWFNEFTFPVVNCLVLQTFAKCPDFPHFLHMASRVIWHTFP